jgi:hypothetical protein
VHLVQASLAGKIEYKDLVVGGVWLVRCRVWPPAGMAHDGGGAIAARAVTYLGTESPPDCAEVAVGVDTMGNVVVRCKELLAVARGCRSVESLSSSSISRALLAFKAVDENGLMFDATWSGTGVAKDQHTCKLMHAMTTVDQLAMRQGNAPAPGHAARLAALKQALNARASVEIEKALARIACTASSCSRANPITVVAEQLGAQEARLPQLETSVASGHECLLQASRVVSVICADFKHLQSLLSQMVKVVAEMAALRAQLRQAEEQIVLHTAASALDVSKESLRLEKQAHSKTQQKLADASARIQCLQHTVDAFDNTDQELAVFVGKGPEFYVHKALNDGGEVAAAFTLHLPVEVDGSAVMRSFTGVLGNGAHAHLSFTMRYYRWRGP